MAVNTDLLIGEMDVKISIEEATEERDPITGEPIATSWATFKRMWAMRKRGSEEKFEANQVVSKVDGFWTIRHVDGILAGMRVNDHGVYHYIKEVKPVDRRSHIVLMTEQRDNV